MDEQILEIDEEGEANCPHCKGNGCEGCYGTGTIYRKVGTTYKADYFTKVVKERDRLRESLTNLQKKYDKLVKK